MTLERAEVVRISTGERVDARVHPIHGLQVYSSIGWLLTESLVDTGLVPFVPEREAKAQPIRDRIAELRRQVAQAEAELLETYREETA